MNIDHNNSVEINLILEDELVTSFNNIISSEKHFEDFVQIAMFSSMISFKQMLSIYQARYPDKNLIIIVKALNYHDDLNLKKIIKDFGIQRWQRIKQRLIDMTKEPDDIFTSI